MYDVSLRRIQRQKVLHSRIYKRGISFRIIFYHIRVLYANFWYLFKLNFYPGFRRLVFNYSSRFSFFKYIFLVYYAGSVCVLVMYARNDGETARWWLGWKNVSHSWVFSWTARRLHFELIGDDRNLTHFPFPNIEKVTRNNVKVIQAPDLYFL